MSQNKRTIAVCTGKVNDDITTLICQQLYRRCKESGYQLETYILDMSLVLGSNDDIEITKEKEIFEILPYEDLDGIVCFSDRLKYAGVSGKIFTKAKENNIPVVCVEDRTEGMINVFFDYGETFNEAIKHIIEKHNCKKIFFIAGMKDNEFSNDRIAVYRDELECHGIEFKKEYIGYGDFWSEPAKNEVERLVNEQGVPDAVCCANDSMAMAVSDKLINMGFDVPGDVIVTGFDGLKGASEHIPSITTVGPYYEKLADAVFDCIYEVVNGEPYEPRDIAIGGGVIEAESCGCKPIISKDYMERLSNIHSDVAVDDFHKLLLMRTISIVPTKNNLKEAFACFEESVRCMVQANFLYVCVWDNYLGANFNRRKSRRHATVVASYVNDEYSTNEINLPMGRNLPFYEELKDKDLMIMYYPIKAANEFFGYLAYGIDPMNCNQEQIIDISRYICIMCTVFLQQTRLNSAYKRLEELYSTDILTQLLNRRGFLDRLEPYRMQNRDKKGVLISVDLNNLKTVNDTWGHLEGDEALRLTAEALRDACPRGSLISRFGGDEYVVFYASSKSDEQIISRFQDRISEAIEEVNDNSDKPYNVYVSYGINITSLDKEYDFDTNYSDADAKMYDYKVEFKKTHNIMK